MGVGAQGLILPSLVLSVYYMGLYVRRLRGALLEEHKKNYVTGARALGLSDSRILWRYIMPNALGLSHINHVRQLFSCTKKASTLAKGRRQV